MNDVEIRKVSDVANAIANAIANANANATSEWITFLFANDIMIVIPLDDGFLATWEIKKDFRMTSIISKDIKSQLDPVLMNKLLTYNNFGSSSSSSSSSSSNSNRSTQSSSYPKGKLSRPQQAKLDLDPDSSDDEADEADLGQIEVELEDIMAQLESLIATSGLDLDLNLSSYDLDTIGAYFEGADDMLGALYDDENENDNEYGDEIGGDGVYIGEF